MNYHDYHFKDFMLDEGFQKWALEPDSGADIFWRNWISQHPGKAEETRKAKQAILELYWAGVRKEQTGGKQVPGRKTMPAPGDQQALWTAISQAIAAPVMAAPALPSPPAGKVIFLFPVSTWSRMAAAVVLLMTVGMVFWYRQPGSSGVVVAYETAFGETRAVTLPDSSEIFLNANSRLTFSQSWAAGEDREVTLAGEAYFAVQPKSKPRKFKVNLLEGAQVEVLGTTFTVTNRPSLTRVVLNQGKVKVGLADPEQENAWRASAIMAPGDLVEIDRLENRLTKTRVARPEDYSAFVQKKIEFNDSPLSEVARVLQDNYGYKVTFVPATIANKRYTGSDPDNRVDLLLFAIEKSFNLQVSRKGKHITIRPR